MSVRHKILALLALTPCYGFQLRSEIEKRGAPQTRVNVGQIYSTLDRLERDGLAFRGETDEHGHVFYEITEKGRALVDEWLTAPVSAEETIPHLAFVLSLPGVDAVRLVAAQRGAIEVDSTIVGVQTETTRLLEIVVGDGVRDLIQAQLRWLGRCAAMLAEDHLAFSFDITDASPRRGRPTASARS